MKLRQPEMEFHFKEDKINRMVKEVVEAPSTRIAETATTAKAVSDDTPVN